jgi:hypothetical protein
LAFIFLLAGIEAYSYSLMISANTFLNMEVKINIKKLGLLTLFYFLFIFKVKFKKSTKLVMKIYYK